jgi:hypothetical protein
MLGVDALQSINQSNKIHNLAKLLCLNEEIKQENVRLKWPGCTTNKNIL